MSQIYYDFLHKLNAEILKTSQVEYGLRALRPTKIGLRHRLQLHLSDFFLAIGFKIRPKIVLPYEKDVHFYNKGSYAS